MSIKSTQERKKQCASSAKKTASSECPSAETILAAIEHPEKQGACAVAIFQHLLECEECRAALAFTCESFALELERKRQRMLWKQFRTRISRWLAPKKESSRSELFDAIAAEASAALILQALEEEDDTHFWRATMTFPDVDQSDASLSIQIDDAKGLSIPVGQFIIFGINIPIANGVGELSRSQLAASHSRGGASFKWQDGCEISGAPVLNI